MLRRVALLIGEIFRRNAAVVPHAPAASMDGRVLSWAELDRAGNRTARALAALGVGHGDRIVSWCDTALDVLPLFADDTVIPAELESGLEIEYEYRVCDEAYVTCQRLLHPDFDESLFRGLGFDERDGEIRVLQSRLSRSLA